MSDHYDFIIAGAGAAGLSLACKLIEGRLSDSRILLIDQDLKQSNDRTWCFWSGDVTDLDHLVYKKWSRLFFLNDRFTSGGDLGRYTYQMIRGVDFYDYAWAKLKALPNVSFKQERVLNYQQGAGNALVRTDKGAYTGKYIFNSCLLPLPDPTSHFLLQHFAGWWIETENPVFNPNEGHLMDFRTPQHDSTRFFYLLPIDTNRALVEYTVFSKNRLSPRAYEEALSEYVEQLLGISHYTITEHENGAIPMTDQVMSGRLSPNVINIGTPGGAVKPTTGYAFANIRRQAGQICAQLEQGLQPDSKIITPKRFRFYDQLLLNILETRGGLGRGIFSSLFRHTSIETILQFLSERTTYWQEAKIFSRLPVFTFLASVWRVFGPVGGRQERANPKVGAKASASWVVSAPDKLQTP